MTGLASADPYMRLSEFHSAYLTSSISSLLKQTEHYEALFQSRTIQAHHNVSPSSPCSLSYPISGRDKPIFFSRSHRSHFFESRLHHTSSRTRAWRYTQQRLLQYLLEVCSRREYALPYISLCSVCWSTLVRGPQVQYSIVGPHRGLSPVPRGKVEQPVGSSRPLSTRLQSSSAFVPRYPIISVSVLPTSEQRQQP